MNKIAIITGASSGIGRAFVSEALKSEEFDELWIVARRAERLAEIAALSSKIIPVTADLGKAEGISVVIDKLEEGAGEVVLLVNSAGMGFRGNIEERSAKNITDTIDLNCTSLSSLTRQVLPFMKEGARIINIASSASFLPQPGFAVYAASKSYVVSFSRALAMELRKRKIHVTAVCPGPVNTEFNALATDGKSPEFTGFRGLVAADPLKLAKASLKASKRGRKLFVYGFTQKALHVVSKIVPTSWILNLLY